MLKWVCLNIKLAIKSIIEKMWRAKIAFEIVISNESAECDPVSVRYL